MRRVLLINPISMDEFDQAIRDELGTVEYGFFERLQEEVGGYASPPESELEAFGLADHLRPAAAPM
jgi:hypothetical protein